MGNPEKDDEVIVQTRRADDVRLAELGYKSEFRREFSVIPCRALNIKVMNYATASRDYCVCVLYNGYRRIGYIHILVSACSWYELSIEILEAKD